MLFVYRQTKKVLGDSEFFQNFEFDLVIFGSVLNGLYDKKNSDLDLTIVVKSTP